MVRAEPISCPEWVIRFYDATAILIVLAAGYLVLFGTGPEAASTPAQLDRSWPNLLVAIATPAFMIAIMWIERRRGRSGEDEYLRRLIGRATSAGVFFTIVLYTGWSLAEDWLLPPSGAQVLGLLMLCTALVYGVTRLRGA